MGWVRFSILFSSLFYSPFLFAHGKAWLRDTLPDGSLVKQLPAVVLRKTALAARVSGDSLVFDAQRYARPGTFRLESLLKDVPGFRLDGEGRIYFNGREISRIMIDGEDLSGERYRLLSRNLRSMIIDSITVIQDYQPNHLLRGLMASAGPAINIHIKKEYQGRVTGSAALRVGFRHLHDADAEGMVLKEKWKQMLFLNRNNNGTQGAGDRMAVTEGPMREQHYDVHPFPFVLESHQALPKELILRNDDVDMTALGSINTGKGKKLAVAAHAGKTMIRQDQVISRMFAEKDNQVLSLLQDLHVQRATEAIALRTSWEKDRGRHLVVRSVLEWGFDHSTHHQEEHRSGLANHSYLMQRGEDRWRMQWDHEVSKRLRKQQVLQWQFRAARGALSMKTRMGMEDGTDSLYLFADNQSFIRKGMLLENHIGMMGMRARIKWKWGWRFGYESVFSATAVNRIGYMQFKAYPYAELNWLPLKKMEFITVLAGGTVWHGERLQYRQPVHALEQRWQWKLKGMLQVQAGVGITRRSADLKNIFAGPVLMQDGIIREGNDQVAFPSIFNVRLGAAQVNLHAGRNWGFMFDYRKTMREMAAGIAFNGNGVLGTPLIQGLTETMRADFHVEQFLLFLKSRIRVNGYLTASALPQWMNGTIQRVRMQTAMVELRLTSQVRGRIGGEYRYQKTIWSIASAGPEGNAQTIRQSSFFGACWFRCRQQLTTQFTWQSMISASAKPVQIISNNWTYDPGKRWNVTLTGENLLDHRSITDVAVDVFGSTTAVQTLNGRRIQAGFRYLF